MRYNIASGASKTVMESLAAIRCPSCSSESFFRNGHRTLGDGTEAQRYLCRECGYRFTDPTVLKSQTNNIGASQQEQNSGVLELLAAQPETKTDCVGIENQTQHGLIVDFQWKMKKRGRSLSTISQRTCWLETLVTLGADLKNPDSVETVLATEEIPTPTKHNIVKTYAAFAKAYGIEWEKITVEYSPEEPFDPLEEEIDLLIAACGRKTATFLQVAKETGARVGEIKQIRYTDIDEKKGTIAINHPEKGSRTRTVPVTSKTLSMIKNMPKKYGDHVFNPHSVSERYGFTQVRKRLAERTQNPRLLKIHFHTLRHWRASREYEKTGDIYAVKDLLGHKSILNTDRYQHGVFKSDEYIIKRPKTSEEEDALYSAGFEFVRFDQQQNVPILRKRK